MALRLFGFPVLEAVQNRQFALEPRQNYFRRLALFPVLVGELASLQLAFEIDLRSFLKIAFRDLSGMVVPDDDVVPLGLVLALAGLLIAPASVVARENETTASPLFVRRTSGSRPRFPIKMTLLTLLIA